MTSELRYGRGTLPFSLPADLDTTTLHLHPLPPLENAHRAIEEALENPIGTPPLSELARGRKNACIVICDVTRPVPNALILEPMLAVLEHSGLARDQITILVATGLHRPNEGDELREMVGDFVFQNYRIENHFARRDEEMAELGEIAFGDEQKAQVSLNAHYVNADLKISTGLIEPHFMAGYSGGRKVICPGIASAQTITQFHAPPMIGHPASRAGNLVENPIHAMSRAVACRVGCDFIVNVTLSEAREVTGVFAGDLVLAHEAGIAHVDKQSKVVVEPAPIVVTSSAGYPLDTTFYQCIKGMVCALPALEKGGTLIIAASLSEGIGGPEFAQMALEIGSAQQFLDKINASPVEIDQWQLQEMVVALQHAGEILIVSDGLPSNTLERFLLRPMPTVEAALEYARQKHGAEAGAQTRAVVIPEGPYVTPVVS